ncbi:unnamed protein product [Arabis nemorensis]|uniref:Uncharacterized protein n=1 Tax=Arabis nemorensis TaxID=586526 RepID=A0A565CC57_9BRAS|nr:unnamed protein product [Arabis nemorensis]
MVYQQYTDLLDEMIKNIKQDHLIKQSCKVWLRKVQSSLKQNEEGILKFKCGLAESLDAL